MENLLKTYKTYNAIHKSMLQQLEQEMSLQKTNGVGLKKGKKTQGYVLVHKSYTDDRKL